MRIFYTADRIMSDGECVIVGRIYPNDDNSKDPLAGHGETVYCATDHKHDKSCAVTLLPSVKPTMEAFFAAWDAAPEDPVHVAMPKKTVQVKEDGKTKTREVDDRDLDVTDLAVPMTQKVMDADVAATMDVPPQ